VDDMLFQDVEVILFLPPYHPVAYELLMDEESYRIIDDVENYIRNIAAERGIQVCGSYDPGMYKLEGTDFVDGMHLHRNSMAKIFRPVVEK
jgi:hypothetical protein